MKVSTQDRNVLRELGKRVAEIAAMPVQQETTRLWKALNGLKPERPMVMIDQMPWHEMDLADELTLRTEGPFCQRLETDLRRSLYRWKHMPVDMVVEPFVRIPKVIRGADFGIGVVEETSVSDVASDVVSHHYEDQLTTEEDLEKIRDPQVELDVEATAKLEAVARGIFDGVLGVQMHGMSPSFSPWDRITQWRSPGAILLDLALRPEFMHKTIARTVEAHYSLLDQLEAQGLWDGPQSWIHCTGGFSDELPADGYDPDRPRGKDIWTWGMAQIFSEVSPEMHEEFELAYTRDWYSRFGMSYYGCCEPLHKKISIIRTIPNLRKISISPWAVQEEAAEQMGGDFVVSRKPSPAIMAPDSWTPANAEKDLRTTIDCCEKYGCPLELIFKDLSTVRYEPQRLWEWAEIAMRLVGA
jgi:hypothetical protein